MSNDIVFKKATLVLAQANYVGGVVELHDTDQAILSSICTLIDTASANAGLKQPTSTAYSQVADANKISISIPSDEIGKVMKKLHELHKSPSQIDVLEKKSASNLLKYIEKLKASDNSLTAAPITMGNNSAPKITMSSGFIGPMPNKDSIREAA